MAGTSGLALSLQLVGEAQIRSYLNGVGLDLRNMRGAMNEVGRNSIKYFSGTVFVSRGQSINQRWPRLSAGYAAQKARTFPGRPPLIRTDKMRTSFAYRSTGLSATIYNTDPKFKYHQSTAPRTKIPRRAMLGVSRQLEQDVTRTLGLALAQKIKARSRRA
ncbi:hypothetical protein HWD35_10320 [Tsukamurella tyrosinosolvens]|uniref:hypothetical protein n=1 Tax=Tsukamurella tyrosinosolvens TaxID=57704 RepID=UPI001CE041B6|nr:hypothetical protein [Tsukamurella tyrosinosolvens]MCA4995106.1 hypothetical protein [Tsukamurella tyrosinosolvens]